MIKPPVSIPRKITLDETGVVKFSDEKMLQDPSEVKKKSALG